MIHVITTKNKTYQIKRKKSIMKTKQSTTVRQQHDSGKSSGGSNTQANKVDLKKAAEVVRNEIARLKVELDKATEGSEIARIKAEIEAVMASVCMSILPEDKVGDKADGASTDGKAAEKVEATDTSTETTDDTSKPKKGVFAWIKENKVKSAVIAAAVVAVAAGVVYAVRTGRTEKLGDAADVLVQRATEAMDGVFSGSPEVTVEASVNVDGAAETGIGTKVANFGKAAWHHVVGAGQWIANTAIKGKDVVVGWFTSTSGEAAAVAVGV